MRCSEVHATDDARSADALVERLLALGFLAMGMLLLL
jgi:hypothetical protein